jgi:hypothetical protein
MKSFMYAAKAIFVMLLFCCSGLAYADGACPPGGDGTPRCEGVEVKEDREREEPEGFCRVDCGGGGERDNGAGSGNGVAAYNPNTLKTDRRFCIRSNDTCDGWFLSATSRCGTIFSGVSSYNCMTDAGGQLSDACSRQRAANTCP